MSLLHLKRERGCIIFLCHNVQSDRKCLVTYNSEDNYTRNAGKQKLILEQISGTNCIIGSSHLTTTLGLFNMVNNQQLGR